MADDVQTSAVDRIERAIGRIEKAADTSKQARTAIVRRHAALKQRMSEAVTALDDVIARGDGS